MLDRLRDRAAKLFKQTHNCTLATTGPAKVQASIVPCTVKDAVLYLCLPDTSDHLLNLEHEPEVALATQAWSLRGTTEILSRADDIFDESQARWHVAIKVIPLQMHILPGPHAQHAETIDFVENQ